MKVLKIYLVSDLPTLLFSIYFKKIKDVYIRVFTKRSQLLSTYRMPDIISSTLLVIIHLIFITLS